MLNHEISRSATFVALARNSLDKVDNNYIGRQCLRDEPSKVALDVSEASGPWLRAANHDGHFDNTSPDNSAGAYKTPFQFSASFP